MKKTRFPNFIFIILAVLLAVSVAMPLVMPASKAAAGTDQTADGTSDSAPSASAANGSNAGALLTASGQSETQVLISYSSITADETSEKTEYVSGLKITGVEDPGKLSDKDPGDTAGTSVTADSAGSTDDETKPVLSDDSTKDNDGSAGDVSALLDTEAAVTTAEGITWEIPVFWLDSGSNPVQEGTPGQDCLPVLAFYVPEMYAVRAAAADAKVFPVTLDAYLTRLFTDAGGAICIYNDATKITYILAADLQEGFLRSQSSDGKRPATPIPGLPEDMRKPSDGTYNNPRLESDASDSDDRAGNGDDDRTEDGAPDDGSGDGGGNGGNGGSGSSTDSGLEKTPGSDDDKTKPVPSESRDNDGSGSNENNDNDAGGHDNSTNNNDSGSSSGNNSGSGGSQGGTAPVDPNAPLPPQKLTNEQLLKHVSPRAVNTFGEDAMADLVDLIINSIEPQAVYLLRTKFPAFDEAAAGDELGKEIGLYVYRLIGDRDTPAHRAASSDTLAYAGYNISRAGDGGGQLGYIIGLNTYYFEGRDENGRRNGTVDTSEQSVADMDNTLLHELLHAFMYDYNRTGSIGMPDPADAFLTKAKQDQIKEIYAFPTWFEEGLASTVENAYQYHYDSMQLLRYAGPGVYSDRYTMEALLNAYTTTDFVLEDGWTMRGTYDLEDPDEDVMSVYVSGYLANLYLGEMAAQYENLGSSVSVSSDGSRQVSSETIRMGLNSILVRLHRGESLDEVIRSISNGRYQNTDDFAAKFIKGTNRAGDNGSLAFCVDYLNYMQVLSQTNVKIPNGSILFGFDEDYTTPIDRSVRMSETIFVINDSSNYVDSTVNPPVPYTDGGKSKPAGGTSGAEAPSGRGITNPANGSSDTDAPSGNGADSDTANNSLASGSDADSASDAGSASDSASDQTDNIVVSDAGSVSDSASDQVNNKLASDSDAGSTFDQAGSGTAADAGADSDNDTASGTDPASGSDLASGSEDAFGSDSASGSDDASGSDSASGSDNASGTDLAADTANSSFMEDDNSSASTEGENAADQSLPDENSVDDPLD